VLRSQLVIFQLDAAMQLELVYHITTRQAAGNSFDGICLYVCVPLCNTIAVESPDLESSFLVCRHIYQSGRVKVTGYYHAGLLSARVAYPE